MARRLALAALSRQLRGRTGVVVAVLCLALGTVVALGEASWVSGLSYGAATFALQLGALWWSARRATRRAMPAGQRLVSRHDADGLLSVTTGLGTHAFAAGSVERAERSAGLVLLRLLPSRHWAVLPGDLFTDEDLAFLSGEPAQVGSASHPDLPLLHVVTPESRQALQRAAVAHAWRGRQGRFTLAAMVLSTVCAALVRDRVTFALLAVLVLAAAVTSADVAARVGRQHPNGLLLHAAVTPVELVVEDREGRSATPWSSIRSCTATRGAVMLTLTSGATVGLPRALFPPGDLARLQQLVRHHGEA